MMRPGRYALLLLLTLLTSGCAITRNAAKQGSEPAPKKAEPYLVLRNGRIFSGAEGEYQWLDAIALRDGEVVLAGKNGALDAMIDQIDGEKRIIDLGGRVVVPGFNDAHAHVPVMPSNVALPDLGIDPSTSQVLAAVRTAAGSAQPAQWISGTIGPSMLFDSAATLAALDAAAGEHPLILVSFAGHAIFLDSRAMQLLKLNDSSEPPRGGVYGRDAHGHLTGRFNEYATFSIYRAIADLATPDDRRDAYRKMSDAALRLGITTIQDMSIPLRVDDAAQAVIASSTPIRWRVIGFPMPDQLEVRADSEIARANQPAPNVEISGLKWVLDGTPVERGAAVTAPYRDDRSTRGTLNFTPVEVRDMLAAALRRDMQPVFHAVGDAAVQQVIDALDATGGTVEWRSRRPRIEHGDLIRPEQFGALARLGVVVVQNPVHFGLPQILNARFDDATLRNVDPFRSLFGHGVMIAIGSDGPMNPGLNILLATTLPQRPAEALTREAAVRAYTWGSAYAERREEKKGLLLPGMAADLAVLSQDIFSVPPDALPRTESVLTIIGGKIVYDSGILKVK